MRGNKGIDHSNKCVLLEKRYKTTNMFKVVICCSVDWGDVNKFIKKEPKDFILKHVGLRKVFPGTWYSRVKTYWFYPHLVKQNYWSSIVGITPC